MRGAARGERLWHNLRMVWKEVWGMLAKRLLLEASGMGDTEDEDAGNHVAGDSRRRGTSRRNKEMRMRGLRA